MENLAIYNQVREVPKEAQKQFSNGKFSGTDINPMWRIKKLTEVFGTCGTGWKWGKPEFTREVTGNTVTIHCVLSLQYKTESGEWSEPVWGVGGNTLCKEVTRNGETTLTISDEGYKMAYTDAQSNAAKMLGVGADIWFASERTKYTGQETHEEKRPAKTKVIVTGDVYAKIDRCKTKEDLKKVWEEYPQFQGEDDFKDALAFQRKMLGL